MKHRNDLNDISTANMPLNTAAAYSISTEALLIILEQVLKSYTSLSVRTIYIWSKIVVHWYWILVGATESISKARIS